MPSQGPTPRIRQAGDAALLLDVTDTDDQEGNGPARFAAAIRAAALPGVTDVVPAARTVLVTVEPGSWELDDLAGQLREVGRAPAPPLPASDQPDLVIPAVYDGPDLEEVAALTKLSETEVIARHARSRYRVGWLGFSPGFGYLTGLHPSLAAVPRLATPRVFVPAGSVAVAGGLAAVYPAASPGGWRLLGRTNVLLWDPGRDPPALLAPGRHVRFRIVDRLPPPVAEASRPARPAGERWIEVLQSGPLTTVQDLGRPGGAHLGVPRSGAADAASLRRANRLAGNPDEAAGLEVTLGGLVLRFEADAVVAVTGAPVTLTLPAGDTGGTGPPESGASPAGTVSARGAVAGPDPVHGTAFAVAAGSVLRLGVPATGLRSYLSVNGGIDVAPVLGSRSADLRSGLGPARLRPGERLPVGRPRSRIENPMPERPRPVLTGSVVLRVIAGPRDDWFSAAALAALGTARYQVSTASDRTGLRLSGPALRRARGRISELPSEGVAAGSLQVTHDGQPILLLADHPTTGGYPVIAVVASDDLGLAGQLRPGEQVQFSVSPSQLASSR
ncbi:MAG TPA: urea amidolyase family protein [Streptosporangiaceae bacterium]